MGPPREIPHPLNPHIDPLPPLTHSWWDDQVELLGGVGVVSQSYLQSGEPAVKHTDCVAVEGQLVLSIQESVQLIG